MSGDMPLSDADIRRTYGQRIAEARTRGELSQRQLADALTAGGTPTSPQAVSQWETGATSPRPSVRFAIAEILGVSVSALFRLDDIEQVA